MVTPSEQRGVVDAARLRLKAAIKAAWSREAVTRGVAAAKKADYALAHRHAAACAAKGFCAGRPPLDVAYQLSTKGVVQL